MKRIIRDKGLPFFSGVTFNSIEGNAVLFRDDVENKLAIEANGALKLLVDVEIHPEKWITQLDRHSPSRRKLLQELVSDQLDVYDQVISSR